MPVQKANEIDEYTVKEELTYVAAAASISCLLAVVKIVNATAKSRVKATSRHSFRVLWPGIKNRIAVGPIRRAVVVSTRIALTTPSIRRLLQRRRCSSSVINCCFEPNSF